EIQHIAAALFPITVDGKQTIAVQVLVLCISDGKNTVSGYASIRESCFILDQFLLILYNPVKGISKIRIQGISCRRRVNDVVSDDVATDSAYHFILRIADVSPHGVAQGPCLISPA